MERVDQIKRLISRHAKLQTLPSHSPKQLSRHSSSLSAIAQPFVLPNMVTKPSEDGERRIQN